MSNYKCGEGSDVRGAGFLALWREKRDVALTRVSAIESAATGARCGSLTNVTRRVGEYDAHKLAGLLNTFGFRAESVLALEAEHLLRGDGFLSRESAMRLVEIAGELRAQLTLAQAA